MQIYLGKIHTVFIQNIFSNCSINVTIIIILINTKPHTQNMINKVTQIRNTKKNAEYIILTLATYTSITYHVHKQCHVGGFCRSTRHL